MRKSTLLVLLVLGISPCLLLGFGVSVLAQDEGIINPKKDYVTEAVNETITCKFPHLSGENVCYNSFHYGNIEQPTVEVERTMEVEHILLVYNINVVVLENVGCSVEKKKVGKN